MPKLRLTLIALFSLSFAVLSAPEVFALDAGAKLPEIGLKDLAGNQVTAASLAGKVVVVDFWASWCTPCAVEMPLLEGLYKKYKDKGLVVVGVSVDSNPDKVKSFVTGKFTFPIVHDKDHAVAGRYKPEKMPSSFIIDRKGIVRHVHAGFKATDIDTFEKEIAALLKDK